MLLPSRSRAKKIEDCIDAWRATHKQSDLLVLLDDDDPELKQYKRHDDVMYDVGSRIRMCPTVNRAILDHPEYKYYGFIGDDHLFRTDGWDQKLISAIENKGNGWGIAYGNDLLQGARLATHCVMSKNILDVVGYMAIPGLTHLYMDDFWMNLGANIDRLFYEPEVIIEHMHFSIGKSEEDPIYTEVNSYDMNSHDKLVFDHWKNNDMLLDVYKVKEAMK
jgi:hypothetical protein